MTEINFFGYEANDDSFASPGGFYTGVPPNAFLSKLQTPQSALFTGSLRKGKSLVQLIIICNENYANALVPESSPEVYRFPNAGGQEPSQTL